MQEEFEALPDVFVRRLMAELPEDAPSVLDGFARRRATGFRLNSLVEGHDDAIRRLRDEGLSVRRVAGHPQAYVVDASDRDRLLTSEVAGEKLIYIQNPSSQLPPLMLDVEAGHRVLDMTAAPGSKTLQLAEMMRDEGELVAVELVRSRFFRMNALLKEYGANRVRTILKNSMDVWRHRPEYFDRILLDAPCASEGRFSVHDESSTAFWTPRKTEEMVRKQRRLLFSAVQCLRPGGRLVYSTCSLSLAENEGVVTDMLEQFNGRVEVQPLPVHVPAMRPARPDGPDRDYHPSITQAQRILPDEFYEGFFMCAITKTASTI